MDEASKSKAVSWFSESDRAGLGDWAGLGGDWPGAASAAPAASSHRRAEDGKLDTVPQIDFPYRTSGATSPDHAFFLIFLDGLATLL